MNNYENMEETVTKICNSLRQNPHDWHFDIVRFHKKSNPETEYSFNSDQLPVTKVWTDSSTFRVFSDKQGERILQSVLYARSVVSNSLQKQIQDCFK